MALRVTAPDGGEWLVRRQWAPRLGPETVPGRIARRLRGVGRGSGKVMGVADTANMGGCLELFGEGLGAAILAIAVVVLAVLFVVPLLLAVLDVVFLLLVAVVGFAVRIALGRPWGESGRTVRQIAARLEAGQSLPPSPA